MHLYVAVRGILDRINRWESDIAATYYPFKLNEENAKKFGESHGMLQTSIRPIRLYEIVAPEEQMPSLLRKIQPCTAWNKRYEKYLTLIRKALGLVKVDRSKIPKRISSDAHCYDSVHVVAIGTKKDRIIDGQEDI